MEYTFFIAASLVVTILLLIYLIYKVRIAVSTLLRMQDMPQKVSLEGVRVTQQNESLDRLLKILNLERGDLPPTRGWAASPDFLLTVARHILLTKPEIVVECGSGVSTLVTAKCLELNGCGHVYSLDHGQQFASITRQELLALGLSERATVIDAPLTEHNLNGTKWLWYALDNLEVAKIDMLTIDGPPAVNEPLARYPAGPLLLPRLLPSGIAFLDDASRDGEKEVLKMWQEEIEELNIVDEYCEKGCVRIGCDS